MSAPRFLISSLVAAGFGHHGGDGARIELVPFDPHQDPATAPRPFRQDHLFTLAGHSSHSSHASHSSGYGGGGWGGGHSSHSSHSSHRSGSGGYDYSEPSYSSPAPIYSPPRPTGQSSNGSVPTLDEIVAPIAAPKERAPAPPPDGLPALSGRTKRFRSIVRRVQIALLAQDFYKGPIDGSVSPPVRGALRKFQTARGLPRTGTITPQTLDALMVASE